MRLSVVLAIVAASCGCATATAQPRPRPWPDAGAPPDATAPSAPGHDAGPEASAEPAGTDPGADADFAAALDRVRGGDVGGARMALEGFVARHPRSGHRPLAVSLVVRLALAQGDPDTARAWLDREGAAAVMASAPLRFAAGLVASRRDEAPRAKELLGPFVDGGPPQVGGLPPEDATLELYAALARSSEALGDAAGALELWGRYAGLARPHEQAFARERATAVAGKLGPDEALRFYGQMKPPVARLALGPKASAALKARGDVGGGERIDREIEELKRAEARRAGDEGTTGWAGRGDPSRFGLALPLSGRSHLLGAAVARGAMLALGEGVPPNTGDHPPPQIVLRNLADETKGGATAATELAREEAVIGVVGTRDVPAATELARDGVPFLVLDDEPPGAQGTAFQLVHSPDARATALAKRALGAGLRAFAVLAPDGPSSKRLAEAFKRAVLAGGGRVVHDVSYVAGATSFVKPVRELAKAPFEAIFVPEDADRLELVAPALAVADLWPRPLAEVTPASRKGERSADGRAQTRNVLLLSTARGLSPRLIERAGRYVQGALLAPGFYADPAGDKGGRFVATFRSLFGALPGAAEAYGHDGLAVLRACVTRGAVSRDQVLRQLTTETFPGATGDLRFGPDHGRADPPLVYEIAGEEIRALK